MPTLRLESTLGSTPRRPHQRKLRSDRRTSFEFAASWPFHRSIGGVPCGRLGPGLGGGRLVPQTAQCPDDQTPPLCGCPAGHPTVPCSSRRGQSVLPESPPVLRTQPLMWGRTYRVGIAFQQPCLQPSSRTSPRVTFEDHPQTAPPLQKIPCPSPPAGGMLFSAEVQAGRTGS